MLFKKERKKKNMYDLNLHEITHMNGILQVINVMRN